MSLRDAYGNILSFLWYGLIYAGLLPAVPIMMLAEWISPSHGTSGSLGVFFLLSVFFGVIFWILGIVWSLLFWVWWPLLIPAACVVIGLVTWRLIMPS